MRFTWDPAKAASNLAKHGMAFEALAEFEWDIALVFADTRFDYGEVRLLALGPIGDCIVHVTFTIRRTETRVISLRRAGNKEVERYEADL